MTDEAVQQAENVDIAIVGGGIVGLGLAVGLRDLDLNVLLLDRSSPQASSSSITPEQKLPYAPRVSAFTVSSMVFLADAGAWQHVNGDCSFRNMEVWDAEGTGRIRFEAAALHQDQLGVIVENHQVLEALTQVVTEQDNVQCCYGQSLQTLNRLDDETHELVLESGRSIRTRLVVGADGGASRVRELAGFRTRAWDYEQSAIVTTVTTAEPHESTAWQRFLPTGPLAFLPLPDTDGQHACSIVWSCRPGLADELMALDDKDFMQRLGEAFEYRLGDIQACNPRFRFPLRQQHAVDYVQPGIALVGDAAHTIHPLAGQGVNLGLQDVEVLLEVIGRALTRRRDFAHVQMLSAYQRRRKRGNLGMMATMEGFKRLFESDDLALRWLRNEGMNRLQGLPTLKNQIMKRAMGV